jgi:hypothetical protein
MSRAQLSPSFAERATITSVISYSPTRQHLGLKIAAAARFTKPINRELRINCSFWLRFARPGCDAGSRRA